MDVKPIVNTAITNQIKQ